MPNIIPPIPDADDRYFWDGVAADKLLLQRCASCHTLRQPPTPMCGACHSLDWDTQESSGQGEVYSWIRSEKNIPISLMLVRKSFAYNHSF